MKVETQRNQIKLEWKWMKHRRKGLRLGFVTSSLEENSKKFAQGENRITFFIWNGGNVLLIDG